jgi:2-phosphosulfolactate phosphatase
VGIAGLVNLTAAVRWAVRERRDVVIVCSGDRGMHAPEDTVCGGLLVRRLAERPGVALSTQAERVMTFAAPYADDLDALRTACPWAQTLIARGHRADVEACLSVDTFDLVPVYRTTEGMVTR